VTFGVTSWGARLAVSGDPVPIDLGNQRRAGIHLDPGLPGAPRREPTGNLFAEPRVGSYRWRAPSPRRTQMSAEQIEREPLRLPVSERARLAERLIASLDEDAEVNRAWVEEVRRRDEELDAGAVQPLPLEDSLRDLRDQLGW